jgi:hypothetical protein
VQGSTGSGAAGYLGALRACMELYTFSKCASFRWSLVDSLRGRGYSHSLPALLLEGWSRHGATHAPAGTAAAQRARAWLAAAPGDNPGVVVDSASWAEGHDALAQPLANSPLLLLAPPYGNEAGMAGEWLEFDGAGAQPGVMNARRVVAVHGLPLRPEAPFILDGAQVAYNVRLHTEAERILREVEGSTAFARGADGGVQLSASAESAIHQVAALGSVSLAPLAKGAAQLWPPVLPAERLFGGRQRMALMPEVMAAYLIPEQAHWLLPDVAREALEHSCAASDRGTVTVNGGSTCHLAADQRAPVPVHEASTEPQAVSADRLLAPASPQTQNGTGRYGGAVLAAEKVAAAASRTYSVTTTTHDSLRFRCRACEVANDTHAQMFRTMMAAKAARQRAEMAQETSTAALHAVCAAVFTSLRGHVPHAEPLSAFVSSGAALLQTSDWRGRWPEYSVYLSDLGQPGSLGGDVYSEEAAGSRLRLFWPEAKAQELSELAVCTAGWAVDVKAPLAGPVWASFSPQLLATPPALSSPMLGASDAQQAASETRVAPGAGGRPGASSSTAEPPSERAGGLGARAGLCGVARQSSLHLACAAVLELMSVLETGRMKGLSHAREALAVRRASSACFMDRASMCSVQCIHCTLPLCAARLRRRALPLY